MAQGREAKVPARVVVPGWEVAAEVWAAPNLALVPGACACARHVVTLFPTKGAAID